MIGRGSRLLKDKNTFEVIDLGNNFYRFGEWGSDIDWHKIFRNPMNYLSLFRIFIYWGVMNRS